MKIQDTLLQNKKYWQAQIIHLEKTLANYQAEGTRTALLLKEAQHQLKLHEKAEKLLEKLEENGNGNQPEANNLKKNNGA